MKGELCLKEPTLLNRLVFLLSLKIVPSGTSLNPSPDKVENAPLLL